MGTLEALVVRLDVVLEESRVYEFLLADVALLLGAVLLVLQPDVLAQVLRLVELLLAVLALHRLALVVLLPVLREQRTVVEDLKEIEIFKFLSDKK